METTYIWFNIISLTLVCAWSVFLSVRLKYWRDEASKWRQYYGDVHEAYLDQLKKDH